MNPSDQISAIIEQRRPLAQGLEKTENNLKYLLF